MSRSAPILRALRLLAAAVLLTFYEPATTPAGLIFNFTEGTELAGLATTNPTLYNEVRGGFNAAAAVWQNVLYDNTVLNFTINYASLGAGILGSTSSTEYFGEYVEIRDALRADAQTSVDQGATNALPNTSSLSIRTNDRDGSVIFDNDGSHNNSNIVITGANARALNLLPTDGSDPTSDASITFSSNFTFDFDRSDGITGGAFDFIGVAAHEIGHALGFVSGIDIVDHFTGAGAGAGTDLNGATAGIGTLDPFHYFMVLDLFRSSSDTSPGVYDWTTGGSPALTLDGGNTFGPLFATGSSNGDGRQASHWKDNLSLGIMDPTLGSGELAILRANDLLALNVIGWDLQAVPEPSSLGLCASAAVAWYVRRRTRSVAA